MKTSCTTTYRTRTRPAGEEYSCPESGCAAADNRAGRRRPSPGIGSLPAERQTFGDAFLTGRNFLMSWRTRFGTGPAP